MKILCIIPAYNERGNLKPLTVRLVQSFTSLSIPFSILFILQGEDGSQNVAEKLKKKFPQVEFVSFEKPLGIGDAYRMGFNRVHSSYSHILTLDADLNHNPQDIAKFFQCMKKHKADIVIGSRFITGGKFSERRLWKRWASMFLNQFLARLLKLRVRDLSSGYRLMRRDAIERIQDKLYENGYPSYMESIIVAHKHGLKLHEVPITYTQRVWGKSKMHAVKTLKDYGAFLLKLPFRF